MWQKRGRPVRVPAAGANRKFVVFGALDYATGQVHWQLSLRDEMLVVVLANVGYHKSRQTLAWW
jgi:hypothetical protein